MEKSAEIPIEALSKEKLNSLVMTMSLSYYDKCVDYFSSSVMKDCTGSYYDLSENEAKIYDDILYTMAMIFTSILSISLPPEESLPIEDRFFALTKEPPTNVGKLLASLKSFKLLTDHERAKVSLAEYNRLHKPVTSIN